MANFIFWMRFLDWDKLAIVSTLRSNIGLVMASYLAVGVRWWAEAGIHTMQFFLHILNLRWWDQRGEKLFPI